MSERVYLGSYEQNGKRTAGIYFGGKGLELFYQETFNPSICATADIICLDPVGKTYQERKEQARYIIFDSHDFNNFPDLSYGELATLDYFCGRLAKRYGLVRELAAEGLNF